MPGPAATGLLPALDDLDPVAVRVAHEADPRAALADAVGRLLRLDALVLEVLERRVEVRRGDRDVVVAGAELVGVDAVVVRELEAVLVAGKAHEDVDRLVADRHAPALLEAQGLVEGDRAVDVADAIAGVDERGHRGAHHASSVSRMVVERSMNSDYLSNTYLVGQSGGAGFFVDAGGPVAPLVAAAERNDITPTHVLLTHHHGDHVQGLGPPPGRCPAPRVLAHADEPIDGVTGTMTPGEPVRVGDLEVTPLHTPGHTGGMLSLLVEGNVFTGDTLFKNSVGGVRAPGSTSYEDLRSSIMDTLMSLPPETVIRPGHTEPTTVAAEWEGNAFIRVWRGVDPEGVEPCTALGDKATLVLLGDDYDGGHKAWVRWPDGRDDIVPGSKVQRG